MPKEIFPSSYKCDCGYQSDHFERTIADLKKLSKRNPQRLWSDDGKHNITFDKGKMVSMWCPKAGKELSANKTSHGTPESLRK